MKTILEPPLINGIHNSSLFFRSDPFFSRLNGGSSLFDDLIDGAQASNNDGRRSNHTTTFTTGNGNTIHITRTVIGGDGSVRREMRFRTPAAPSNAEPNPRPTARVQPTSRPPPPNNTSNRYTFFCLFVRTDGRTDGLTEQEQSNLNFSFMSRNYWGDYCVWRCFMKVLISVASV